MIIRAASLEDLEFILALEARPDYIGFIAAWPHAEHAARLADPDNLYLIAETDGAPVGFAILRQLTSPDRAIKLQRIAVATPGQGVGGTLLRTAIERTFGDLRARRLWLYVNQSNERARQVYLGYGFKEQEVKPTVRRDGVSDLHILMSLDAVY
jgi:ribosomal protein S18 acetylase RimI-like enzyme